jgi:hypothetical protein
VSSPSRARRGAAVGQPQHHTRRANEVGEVLGEQPCTAADIEYALAGNDTRRASRCVSGVEVA